MRHDVLMLHRHPFLSVITVVYLGFVGWMTLTPHPYGADVSTWLTRTLKFFARHDATAWITYTRVEIGSNVLMFVPVGLFFLLLFGRRLWWLSILLCIAMTVGIETAQMFMPTRFPQVSDLLANTSGGVIGVLFGLALTWSKARHLRELERVRLQAQDASRARRYSDEVLQFHG